VSSVPEIDVDGLEGALGTGCVLIDVREDDEYADGHIPGARHVPLGEVVDRQTDFPSDSTFYVVCAMGGRSARAVEFLRSSGLDAVNVTGGTQEWIASGRGVERGTGTP